MIPDQHVSIEDQAQLIWLAKKLGKVSQEELRAFQPRVLMLQLAASLLPPYVGGRLRGPLMRLVGAHIGKHITIMSMPHMYGYGDIGRRLTIGNHSFINVDCHFDLNDTITIADHVSLGHEVMVLTTSHDIGDSIHRAGELSTKPVSIGAGAWIGARSVILPGVRIGAGTVVGAGAIVTKDLPPDVLAAGVPARVLRHL